VTRTMQCMHGAREGKKASPEVPRAGFRGEEIKRQGVRGKSVEMAMNIYVVGVSGVNVGL
jgi:hypothetical protein